MKANELMIFDLVRRKKDNRTMIVVEVGYDENIGAITTEDRFYGDFEEYHETQVEPIPITPEILEKNGFERDFEDGSLIWVDEQDVTEVVWGGTILTIHGENGHLELDTCMYVHELQRALRCVGLFELANNIKL